MNARSASLSQRKYNRRDGAAHWTGAEGKAATPVSLRWIVTLVAVYPNVEKGKEASSVRSRARSEHLTLEPHVTEPSRCATLGVREDIRDFEREIRAGFINNLEVIGK